MRYYPPQARDKLHTQPWTGPHEVIESRDDILGKLRIYRNKALTPQTAGPRDLFDDKWWHVRHLKPFSRTPGPDPGAPGGEVRQEEVFVAQWTRWRDYWTRSFPQDV